MNPDGAVLHAYLYFIMFLHSRLLFAKVFIHYGVTFKIVKKSKEAYSSLCYKHRTAKCDNILVQTFLFCDICMLSPLFNSSRNSIF